MNHSYVKWPKKPTDKNQRQKRLSQICHLADMTPKTTLSVHISPQKNKTTTFDFCLASQYYQIYLENRH